MAGFLDLTGLSRFKKKLLEAVYEINEFRRKSTAYNVGDKVDCAFQYERFLECTKAGTTSADLLDTRSVTHGQVIADGTVEWTVRTHVRSVNGNVAGADGNVPVDVGVKTVNGNGPDGSGNVKVDTGLPLGHLFAWPYQTPPDGAIQCNGATYNRSLYKDFFAYATSKGWVKTEAEWQSIASANGGYCPYYSQGDGSTTFRTPKFAPFMQIAIAGSSAGKYHKAGLPNIKGTFNASQLTDGSDSASGALIVGGGVSRPTPGSASDDSQNGFSFDASKSNVIYGRSSTVQPELNEWMICVVVAGQATNLGSVDMADVLTTVAQVQADVSQVQADVDAIPRPNAYVTKTWRSGTEWYRVWSDGWIEQGGHGTGGTCTFNKSFSNTNYTFNVQPSSGYTSHPDWIAAYEHRSGRTTAKTSIKYYEGGNQGWDWRASGY